MNTIKMLGLAAAAALSLGIGAAMAQEGANDTISGSTYFGNQTPLVQAPAGQPGMVQSGSADVQQARPSTTNTVPGWTPGVAY